MELPLVVFTVVCWVSVLADDRIISDRHAVYWNSSNSRVSVSRVLSLAWRVCSGDVSLMAFDMQLLRTCISIISQRRYQKEPRLRPTKGLCEKQSKKERPGVSFSFQPVLTSLLVLLQYCSHNRGPLFLKALRFLTAVPAHSPSLKLCCGWLGTAQRWMLSLPSQRKEEEKKTSGAEESSAHSDS
ncbi:hypothetical protein QQF64_014946 [Cirrhinus molitorella]|uniref:Uncharacterized protein n=1 Tax=Cirrhinus molitorella TaxID=172907 RepID=A0ABR3NTL0_9TELE